MNTIELVQWINKLIDTDRLWKFYKSIEFRHLKEEVLREQHYECQECKKKGKITKANTVHHVQFVRKHPELALSKYYTYKEKQYKNLIAVCPACHNRIHTEKGGYRKDNIYVVTGLPGAGKTTYVQSHMQDNDLVYDLDFMANAISYNKNNFYSRNLANKLLSSFIKEASKLNTNTYIIRSIPNKEELELFERYNVIYIDIKEDANVCYERRKEVITKEKFEEKIFKHEIYLKNKKENEKNGTKMEERW